PDDRVHPGPRLTLSRPARPTQPDPACTAPPDPPARGRATARRLLRRGPVADPAPRHAMLLTRRSLPTALLLLGTVGCGSGQPAPSPKSADEVRWLEEHSMLRQARDA